MIKAQLTDVGTSFMKANKTVKVKNIRELHDEINKTLGTTNWSMEDTGLTEIDNIYDLVSDGKNVGIIKILEDTNAKP